MRNVDINECMTDNGGCTHNCNNTAGSYQCYCEDGYKLNSDDHTCDGKTSPYEASCAQYTYKFYKSNLYVVDNDECQFCNGGYDHDCTNTNGSYYCSCYDGYILKEPVVLVCAA